MKKLIVLVILVIGCLFPAINVLAQDTPQVDFFYSETCPHCRAEHKFLDNLQKDFPNLSINRYPVSKLVSREIMIKKAKELGKEDLLGAVPVTIIGDTMFVGFDNDNGMGANIRSEVEKFMDPVAKQPSGNKPPITLPILGHVDVSAYSLPALAVVLGFLDGFNVCSLGALALILGLVIALRDRKKIFLFGGIFILTTAVVYGLLISFWHKLFSIVAGYSIALELAVGVLGIVGGYYLFREFLACRKAGPACKFGNIPMVRKVSLTVQKAFSDKATMVTVLAAIFAFAAVITIVEFPCSAAIPMVFAGILANNQVSTLTYLGLITIFLLFYLLDELIVYVVATTKMSMWMGNPKVMTYAVLIESLLLLGIGGYYIATVLGL